MTTKNEYTKWEYNKEHGLIFADGIAVVCVSDLPDGEATAKLICTLVNAAQEIGEPMKVAENLKDMHRLLGAALSLLNGYVSANDNKRLKESMQSVLSAIEKE
jgi:hypothetical protein